MESQPGLLAAMLRQRSEELADFYDTGRARLEEALAGGELRAVHGPDHWRNIEMYAARLVPERVLGQMAAAEIAVMAAACILHDLRHGDQELAVALSREPERWGMHQLSAVAVRQVCEAMTVGGVRLWRGQRWAY
ncbi:MAG: hypothetical protein HYU66_02350, partial [Armatimonadetes bacterium]|nr:hypothetical protein [Armatimonadota bacterium]